MNLFGHRHPTNDPSRTAPGKKTDKKNPSEILRYEHEELERSLLRLLDFLKGDDATCAREEWTDLESNLLQHLNEEEMFLLPPYEIESPSEAGAIRSEHAEIRRKMGEIGLALELHTLRAEHVEAFAKLLERHKAREFRSLYAWVDRAEDQPLVEAAYKRLHDAARSDLTLAMLMSLVRVCRDGEAGYRRAAASSHDEGYRQIFQRYADQRARFAGELRGELEKVGVTSALQGSILGKVHRGWIDAAGALSDGNANTLLRECERGEQAALKVYGLAMHAGLSPQLQERVEDQHTAVRHALEEVRSLLTVEKE